MSASACPEPEPSRMSMTGDIAAPSTVAVNVRESMTWRGNWNASRCTSLSPAFCMRANTYSPACRPGSVPTRLLPMAARSFSVATMSLGSVGLGGPLLLQAAAIRIEDTRIWRFTRRVYPERPVERIGQGRLVEAKAGSDEARRQHARRAEHRFGHLTDGEPQRGSGDAQRRRLAERMTERRRQLALRRRVGRRDVERT